MADLDPRFTFEEFVIGPANRLAAAAAKRAAETPGSSYNPLFVYSASGLGKSHILGAIAHHVARIHPDRRVVYETLEGFLLGLTATLQGGRDDSDRSRYDETDILLMDDVQFLTGQPEAQEMLLGTLDRLTGDGRQVVLACDRPPAEIDGLGARLRSRFEGGLLVDIGPPEYETRVAIVRKKTEARGQTLSTGVADVIGRIGFRNVRELSGALNRVLAVQELEERILPDAEVRSLLGFKEEGPKADSEMEHFLADLSESVSDQVAEQEAPWRVLVRDAVEELDRGGFKADRLRFLLERETPSVDVPELVARFRAAVQRLDGIRLELEEAGNPWPEAAHAVLRDPDRLSEAEDLLASAKERAREFPPAPPGPTLDQLANEFPPLVLRAAEQLLETDRPEYSPLFVWSPDGEAARSLLAAAGRTFVEGQGNGGVAFVSVAEFAAEFIDALSAGVAGAWRERWWSGELLLVHGTEDFSRTEQAQDEFFHLFEALQRRRARVMVAADRPPSALTGINDRLRSRFEGGLVLEIDVDPSRLPAEALVAVQRPVLASAGDSGGHPETKDVLSMDREWIQDFQPHKPGGPGLGTSGQEGSGSGPPWNHLIDTLMMDLEEGPEIEKWFPSQEVVFWDWPNLEDRIVEDPD